MSLDCDGRVAVALLSVAAKPSKREGKGATDQMGDVNARQDENMALGDGAVAVALFLKGRPAKPAVAHRHVPCRSAK